MSRRQASSRARAEGRASRSDTGKGRDVWLWSASAVLYLILVVVLAPTLDFPALDLDDTGTLRELGGAAFGEVLGYDRFGHMRPAKGLLFWFLAQHPESLGWARAAAVGAFVLSTLGLQWLASSLLGSQGWGLAAAACFALNPTVIGTVAWLSTANYVLCLLFTLGFVLAAARALGVLSAPASEGGPSIAAGALAGVSLTVAVLHHELALLAPLLLLVYPTERARRGVDRAVVVCLLLGWLVAACLQVVPRLIADRPDIAYRMAQHPKWALVLSSARYLFTDLALWAHGKAFFGVLWVDDPTANLAWSLAAWAGFLLLVAGAARLWRADPVSRFAIAWSALFLLPVTNLVPLGVTVAASHYLFLPAVGLACLLVRTAQRVERRLRTPGLRPGGRGSHRLVAAAPAGFVVLLAAVWLSDCPRAVALWGDEESLLRAALHNHPGNIEVRANLASDHIGHERWREAEALLEDSLKLAPHDPVLLRNRVLVFRTLGPPAAALAFLEANAEEPALQDDEYRFARAELLEILGRGNEALALFNAIEAGSADRQVRVLAAARQAKLLAGAGRAREGQRIIERLLREYPGNRELLVMHDLMIQQQQSQGAGMQPHRTR